MVPLIPGNTLKLATRQASEALMQFLQTQEPDALLWARKLYAELSQLCTDAISHQIGGFSAELLLGGTGPVLSYVAQHRFGKGVVEGSTHAVAQAKPIPSMLMKTDDAVHLWENTMLAVQWQALGDKSSPVSNKPCTYCVDKLFTDLETYGAYLGYHRESGKILTAFQFLDEQPLHHDLEQMIIHIVAGKVVTYRSKAYGTDSLVPDSVNVLCTFYRENPQLNTRIRDIVQSLILLHDERIAQHDGYSHVTFERLMDYADRMKIQVTPVPIGMNSSLSVSSLLATTQ